jgi:LCP family protein required for cell wall assembly
MSLFPPPPGGATPPPPSLPTDFGPGPPPSLPVAGKRSRRWWLAPVVAVLVYVFLALVTLVQPVGVAGLTLAVPIPGVSTASLFGLPDRSFTVMVVGLDIRPTQDGPSRTDSILLLRVDPGKDRAGVLSIPRDAMMQVPYPDGSVSQDRINTAYVYNWSEDDPEAAPDALARTIEENLGISIDYYAVFDQRGAAKIIDAAGGVTVKVREAFGQDNYSDDDVTVVPQYFPQGEQHLNGYEAVAYGRIREGSSDFDRINRQQQVAEGLVSELSSPLSITRMPGVWSAYDDAIDTDLGLRQSAGLFVLLKRIGTDRIVTRSLGDAAVPCNWCNAALVLLQPDVTARLISEAFDDDAAGSTAADLLVAAGVTP